MKRCSKCGQEKTLDNFAVRKDAPGCFRGVCIVCQKITKSSYYQAHRDIRLAQQKIYASKHREERRAYIAQYSVEHQTELNAYQASYREDHREESRAYFRQHYQDHHEHIAIVKKAYRKSHRDEVRAHNNLRKARRRNAPINDFTGAQWKALKAAYGYRCAYCGTQSSKLTMDHVIPLAKGGAHTAGNIVPTCLGCNIRKKVGPAPIHQPVMPELLG